MRNGKQTRHKRKVCVIKLDSLQKFRHVVMERPYTYTEQAEPSEGDCRIGVHDSGQLGSHPGSNGSHP